MGSQEQKLEGREGGADVGEGIGGRSRGWEEGEEGEGRGKGGLRLQGGRHRVELGGYGGGTRRGKAA